MKAPISLYCPLETKFQNRKNLPFTVLFRLFKLSLFNIMLTHLKQLKLCKYYLNDFNKFKFLMLILHCMDKMILGVVFVG